MLIEILVEEQSAEEALRHLLPKLLKSRARAKVINLGSKHKLLKSLPHRMAAYAQRIASGESLRVVVLVDRDRDDCAALKAELERVAAVVGLPTKSAAAAGQAFVVLNRIVVEELESWFIGDPSALCKAFTGLPRTATHSGIFRNPDNGGSWEALHRFLKRHGIYKNSFPKIDAARRIAPHMDVRQNRSRSFQVFVDGMEALLA